MRVDSGHLTIFFNHTKSRITGEKIFDLIISTNRIICHVCIGWGDIHLEHVL